MIIFLRGIIKKIREEFIILDVRGVGYQVFCTRQALHGLQNKAGEVEIYTHQHIREDSQELYGFLTLEELDLFEIIISVSGVGPSIGLAILDIAGVSDIKKAIATANVDYLTRVPGIGRKKAELIILDLKSKMDVLAGSDDLNLSDDNSDSVNALVRLGYSRTEALAALENVPQDVKDAGERIKLALQDIGKK